VIDAIADRGTIIMARRVHGHLHRLFAWSVGRSIIDVNPLANVDRPGSETKRERVLTDGELVAIWNAAADAGYPYGDIFKLLILTGGRRDEIGRLRWSEIADGQIELTGLRTKNGQPHIIPLSTLARAVIEQLARIDGGDAVFTKGKGPVNGWALIKSQLDAASKVTDWRIHDLRRTAATGLQKLGLPVQVTEAVLGHVSGSRGSIVGVYQRHDYAAEKRAALEAWGAHVMALVEGGPLGKALH
jgi:integrase